MPPESVPRDRSRVPRPGAHARAISTLSPEVRIRNFDEVYLPWPPETVMEEAGRCLQCPDAPCTAACPLGIPLPEALGLAAVGDFEGAARVFRRANNLPEICGRVCPKWTLCEGACPHGEDGERPLAIGRVASFLTDRYWPGMEGPGQRPPFSGHRVLVVGAGPSGLTAAELLALEGHRITVFEQWPHGGGFLRYGLPRFKLDHTLIQRRLEYLRGLGVQFVFDTRVGEEPTLDTLLSERFDAAFLGTGGDWPSPPGIPGDDLHGVYRALPFLVRANVEQNLRPSEMEDPPVVGGRVAVVGGGDTAMDCCRAAVRLGAREVTCYCGEAEAEAPGSPEDRALAREEGVTFRWQVSPMKVLPDGSGGLRGLLLARMRGSVPDSPGPRSAPLLPSSSFEVVADTVILAPSLTPKASPPRTLTEVEATGLRLTVLDPSTGRTDRRRIWVGGASALGYAFVAHAVAHARAAARDIHRELTS